MRCSVLCTMCSSVLHQSLSLMREVPRRGGGRENIALVTSTRRRCASEQPPKAALGESQREPWMRPYRNNKQKSSLGDISQGGFPIFIKVPMPGDHRTIRAELPPDFSLVTMICLSMRSFSSATWEMMPTSRLPSVRPARVL